MLVLGIIFTFVAFASSLEDEQPLINTPLGAIKGHYKLSYGNRTFAAFEGIPYAKPPVGDLRFAEPHDIEPWTGIWNATTTHVCIQYMPILATSVVGDEDCLYLNVYVPKDKLNSNQNMDVLMHIHGGAFMAGSPAFAGPEYLMDRNIVYVNINYRVGSMGFLSTEDHVVSGNNGLKDQVQALKWIQNNIKHFGGNPESVTITGVSAGGAAVHLHYFSPLARGLYHRGIAQSGTALCPWAIQDAPLENAKRLASLVGCNESASKDFIKCMRQRSAKQIVENVQNFTAFSGLPLAPFAPVIEKSSQNAFLTDYPYKMLENRNINDVPLIFTVTTDEGILGLQMVNNALNELNERWDEVLPYALDYNYTVKAEDRHTVAQKIKEFYLNGNPVSEDNIPSLIKLFGDRYFTLDFEKSSRMHAKVAKSPVYSYIYGYRQDLSFGAAFGIKEDYGVGHGWDGALIYFIQFGNMVTKRDKLPANDEMIKNLLLDFITSFAKTGKPEAKNIEWDAVTTNSENFGYLFIHKTDDVKMAFKKEVAPTEFWHSLPIKEYEKFENK